MPNHEDLIALAARGEALRAAREAAAAPLPDTLVEALAGGWAASWQIGARGEPELRLGSSVSNSFFALSEAGAAALRNFLNKTIPPDGGKGK